MEEKKKPIKIELKVAILWIVIIIVLGFIIFMGVSKLYFDKQDEINNVQGNMQNENLPKEQNMTQGNIFQNTTGGISYTNKEKKNFVQFNTTFERIEEVAQNKVNLDEIDEKTEIEVDLNNDGVPEIIKKEKGDDEDPLGSSYHMTVNGEIFHGNNMNMTTLYVVDFNKDDKYLDIVIYDDLSGIHPTFWVYSYNGTNVQYLKGIYGPEMYIDGNGKVIVENTAIRTLNPKIATGYYEYTNNEITYIELNVSEISDVKFNIDTDNIIMPIYKVYFTENLKNVEDVLKKLETEDVSYTDNNLLESCQIYDLEKQNRYKFNGLQIVEFPKNDTDKKTKIKLEDGTEGYIFMAIDYFVN